MNRFSWSWVLAVVLCCVPVGLAGEKAIAPDLAKINDAKVWNVINGEISSSVEDGKSVVRLYPIGGNRKGSNNATALVEGLEFGEGTIEVDLKGRGKENASFVGVAFCVGERKNFEAVYFRPFRFQDDNPALRTHAVQYVAWPEHTWERLRTRSPGVYESAVNPVPDPAGWFHARIEVAKKKVSVFVNDAKEPCLVVDRLGSLEKGKVGLWVDSQEGWFSNLKIQPAK